MPISISMIALSSQLVVTVADRVPTFDVVRSCKPDVAATAGLAVDQWFKYRRPWERVWRHFSDMERYPT